MTNVLTSDIVGACDIDVDIVPLPQTCASSFFQLKLFLLLHCWRCCGNIPLSLPTSMARGLTFTVRLTALIALTCCATAMVNHNWTASSCGNIHNISFPFRLKTDPENCGYFSYELWCENNRTVVYLNGEKNYVEEISYNNYTIRIVDSSIHKDNYFSFSTPTYSLSRYDLRYDYPYNTYLQKGTKANYWHLELARSLVWMSCEKPVNSPLYLDTLLAIIMTTLLLYLIPRGIDMLKLVEPTHPKWRTRSK